MKIKYSYLVIILLLELSSFGQNLIPNPSFEDTINCASQFNNINAAFPWYNACGTPDYFSLSAFPCGVSPINTPNSSMYQYPHIGIAFAGLYLYGPSNLREYIGVKLANPLSEDYTYCLSMYVNLNNNSRYGTDRIGAYFSLDSIFISYAYPTFQYAPQAQLHSQSTSIVLDTVNWVKVEGDFVANGGEQYMTIGNFFDNNNSNIDSNNTTIGGSTTYYSIDDVSLVLGSCPTSSIDNRIRPNNYKLYPNPTSNTTTLEFENSNHNNYNFTLYDSHGRMVQFRNNISSNKIIIKAEDLSKGIYYFQITHSQTTYYTGKLLVE